MEQMLICLSLALIAGLLMSRAAKAVRLPAVTAYLLTGLLLGPFFLGRLGLSRFGFGFGSLAAVEGYGIITQVALGFIAFVIGNEFRLSALKHMGRRAVTVGIAHRAGGYRPCCPALCPPGRHLAGLCHHAGLYRRRYRTRCYPDGGQTV